MSEAETRSQKYDKAITLLRALRDTTDPNEIREQVEAYALLSDDLNPSPPVATTDDDQCPFCKAHPHRQACCHQCEDARIATAERRGYERCREGAVQVLKKAWAKG